MEIQVRTIFEEAWSEIDHRINYPLSAPPSVSVFLGVLNRLAGSADEMVSFIYALATELEAQSHAITAATAERDAAVARVEELVSKMKIGEKEKGQLERELNQLRQQSRPAAGSVVVGSGKNFESVLGTFTLPPTPTYLTVGSEPPAFDFVIGGVTNRCQRCFSPIPAGSTSKLCAICGPVVTLMHQP